MTIRSIASLSISFGLVAIPIKVYSATESSAALKFKLMTSGGGRVRQQYVSEAPSLPEKDDDDEPVAELLPGRAAAAPSKVVAIDGARRPAPLADEPDTPIVERSSLVKGYEYARGQFVLFTEEELKALEAGSRKTIDIVSFIPERSVDPVYYQKAYYLAPDRHGAKPYRLLLQAMQDTGRCAIAKWAFRAREYVVQIRTAGDALVLQQLFYADEVRSPADLRIEPTAVSEAERVLARQLIEQISSDAYDPAAFVDEEKQRILAAVEEKKAGRAYVAPSGAAGKGGNVVDLLSALRASLKVAPAASETRKATGVASVDRKPSKRAARSPKAPAAERKSRARKRSS